MASLRSLGVHTPSAFTYLVAEHILPEDASEAHYTWDVYNDEAADGLGEEEVISTDYCVAYSRGSVVRKVFRFEAEQQKVVQAILTWFPSDDVPQGQRDNTGWGTFNVPKTAPSQDAVNPHDEKSTGTGSAKEAASKADPYTSQGRSRALVVLLKFQAHVFFLSGSNHVVNLPFEVDKVFAAPRGLILQRKVPVTDKVAPTPVLPAVPQNSFLSSQSASGLWSQPAPLFTKQISPRQPKLSKKAAALFEELAKATKQSPQETLPRLYSFTDPLSEIGLVVTAPALSKSRLSSVSTYGTTGLEALDKAEEVIYVSRGDELSQVHNADDKPLLIVVTCNFATRKYSFWSAHYLDHAPASSRYAHQVSAPGTLSKRRSSFNPGMGTGTTTPAIRVRDGPRESFGNAMRHQSVSASFAAPASQNTDQGGKQSAEDALAFQLDPEHGMGLKPAKNQRRVSSLLSRVDLSTSFDRSAFNDLAANHNTVGGHVIGGRRGQSFGGYSDRVSFGGGGFPRTRLSTPGSMSRLSIAADSVNARDEDTVMNESNDALNGYGFPDDEEMSDDYGLLEGMGLQEPIDRLKKEFVLVKFEELPMTESNAHTMGGTSTDGPSPEDRYRPRVFIVISPLTCSISDSVGHRLFLHIMNQTSRDHLELECSLHRTRIRGSQVHAKSTDQKRTATYQVVPSAEGCRRSSGHLDALKITDGDISRVLCLGPRPGDPEAFDLSLYAGWAKELVSTIEVGQLNLFNPYSLGPTLSPSRKTAGLRRTLRPPGNVAGLESPGSRGLFNVVDSEGCKHRLQLQLRPNDENVFRALQVCRFVLPGHGGEALLALWWSIMKDLSVKETPDPEWTALVVTLFSLAVDLVDGEAARLTETSEHLDPDHQFFGAAPKERSPDSTHKSGSWARMLKLDSNKLQSNISPVWNWIGQSSNLTAATLDSSAAKDVQRRSDFIFSCVQTSRRLSQAPYNRRAISQCRIGSDPPKTNPQSHALPLVRLSVGLHLLREEYKLNMMSMVSPFSEKGDLGPVLAQLNGWLGWEGWDWREGGYYDLDDAGFNRYVFEDASISRSSLDVPPEPWPTPPSIYQWVEQSLDANMAATFPTLKLFVNDRKSATAEKASLEYIHLYISTLTPRTLAITKILPKVNSVGRSPAASVEFMAECGLDRRLMETLPDAILAPLREAVARCQANPPTTWSSSLFSLVGRQDLNLQSAHDALWRQESHSLAVASIVGTRDVHSICQATEQSDGNQSSLLEADRFMITRLIFNEDRRFIEAARILEPLRPAVVECPPHPSWSEAEYLEAQKEVVQWVMVRTFALPPGQAMLSFDSRKPLLTEKYPLHGFTTMCLMQPMNNTVSADRSSYTEEKFCWAFFHAGVSAGLSISSHAEGIDTSWIVFNKPAELSNKHAGLLLALGLNGHLKSIAKWLAFKYLTPKHTMTSIGLLLGLSTSFLGTMDQLVTRLLSVHVTRMLPQGAAELNLSPLTQTSGLMGMGLVYCNTQHRRMSEVMLSEIEHIEVEDPSGSSDVLRDEGYRLAAGFALGYINLGKGQDLKGLHDMRMIERLLTVAVGPKPVNVVHVLDRATAGATIAVALIFMKTGNEAVARKINVPDTLPQFDYVRPDLFLLRTVAKHIIMWDDISADDGWILRNIPREYVHFATLESIKSLRSSLMPYYNIVAGLLWSVGLRYAGSGDTNARDFLVKYLDEYIRICQLSAETYDTRLARNTARNCQDVVALAAATVMAGTGDLVVFRRLRLLHGRIHPDTPYGSHLAAHMALGALFLGGGSYTFGTTNLAVASLLCAFYPLFPTNVLDNKAHLQAFRHFWVLAAEPRCLIVRDVDTRRAISLPITATLKPEANRHRPSKDLDLNLTAPCLLPALDSIAQIRTASPDYWPVTLDFAHNPTHLPSFRRTQTIHVRRRPARDAHASTFAATLAARADADATPASAAGLGSSTAGALLNSAMVAPRQMATPSWDWIARLAALARRAQIDSADWALVLPPDPTSAVHADMAATVVDVRLALGRAAEEAWTRDELWNLRVLFAWAERALEREGSLKWLGREVVDGLRARIAERAGRL